MKLKSVLFSIFLLSAAMAFAQEEVVEDAPPAEVKVYADSIEKNKLEGEKVILTAEDGVEIAGVFMRAGGDEEERLLYVVLLHELGKNKSSFYNFSQRLKNQSIGYLAIDLRGHGASAASGHYTTFKREGADNQFNKMTGDVNAAVKFLKEEGVPPGNIFIVGAGLGANVAAKSLIFNEDVGGAALLTPSANNRDVLSISGIRMAKPPVFIAAASDVKKNFFEASIIRNNAFINEGFGRITFATSFDKEGTDMLDAYLAPTLIQWFLTPVLPPVAEVTAEPVEDVI